MILITALALLPAFAVAAADETAPEGGSHEHKEAPPSATLDLSRWGKGIYYLDGTELWEEGNKMASLQRQPFIAYGKAYAADTRLLA